MRAALFTMALSVVAQPSLAQRQLEAETGSRIGIPERARIPTSLKLTDGQAAQITMNRFMTCVVQRSRKQAERFVALPPESAETSTMARSLATSECLHEGELRFQSRLMRGGAYQALYRADYGVAVPANLATRATVRPPAGQGAAAEQYGALLNVGDCVARVNAIATHDLLLSDPAAAAEATAISKLMPSLSACMPQGVTLRFSKPVLRGVLAEAAYRLAKSPVAVDTGAGSGTP